MTKPTNDHDWWYGQPAPRQLTVQEPKGRILDAKGRPVHRVIGFHASRPEYDVGDGKEEPNGPSKA